MLNPFYLIIDDALWLERFLPLGLKLVQLRIKDKTLEELKTQIQAAKKACDAYGCQLIINDYWQLAIELGCDYVHLGQEDLVDTDIAALRKANIKLGVSTHDDAELDYALSLKPDYIALGPVYPTILKKMKWAPQGIDKLTGWKQKLGNTPLVAIGGMKPERAAGAYAAGADSIAVVTDVLLHQQPEQRLHEWLKIAANVANDAANKTPDSSLRKNTCP